MKVLIADDDQVVSRLLSARMAKAGHDVLMAQDAMQAIMVSFRDVPDLLILDIHMPGGNGSEVIRRLKASSRTNQIPILVVSGSSSLEEQRAMISAGAIGYMAKQTSLHHLEKMVAALLQLSGRAAAPQPPRPWGLTPVAPARGRS